MTLHCKFTLFTPATYNIILKSSNVRTVLPYCFFKLHHTTLEAVVNLQYTINVWLLKEILQKQNLKIPDNIIQFFHMVEMQTVLWAMPYCLQPLKCILSSSCICELLISFLTQRSTFSYAMETPYFSSLRETRLPIQVCTI